MRIEVPLSPLDVENDVEARQSNGKRLISLNCCSKSTPLARIQAVNASTPHSVQSFCLERTPLSDIHNNNETHRFAFSGSAHEKLGSGNDEFRLREQGLAIAQPESEQSTPTLVTGMTPGSAKKRHSRHSRLEHKDIGVDNGIDNAGEKIAALERELASLKDVVVELDGSKRAIERLLEEEREARVTMAREFALREGALYSRIETLKGMLKMVSLEKERLISFETVENAVREGMVAALH